jgi:hypothetical protein
VITVTMRGCIKWAIQIQGGVCISHYSNQNGGCIKWAIQEGVCVAHSAKMKW